MAEAKERSGIFKFFYVILSVITFPIFIVIFILRHPLWVLFLLCLAAGGLAYYPLSQGVAPEKICHWYMERYTAAKLQLVTEAAQSGKADFIPQAIIDDVEAMKKRMEEDAAEAKRPKGENYNAKISRDDKIEEKKAELKKKKSGFKKASDTDMAIGEPEKKAKVLEESGTAAGSGLAAVLKKVAAKNNADAADTKEKGEGTEENSLSGRKAPVPALAEKMQQEGIQGLPDAAFEGDMDEAFDADIKNATDEKTVAVTTGDLGTPADDEGMPAGDLGTPAMEKAVGEAVWEPVLADTVSEAGKTEPAAEDAKPVLDPVLEMKKAPEKIPAFSDSDFDELQLF